MSALPSSSGSASIEIMPDSPNRFYYRPSCSELSSYAELEPGPSEAVHVHGRVRVRVKEKRLVKQLLVRFRTVYHIDAPHQPRKEGILLERTLLFGMGGFLSLDAGDNYFDYLFVLGNHLPSLTSTPWGRIFHTIEAQINGVPTSRFGGFFGSRSPRSPSKALASLGGSPEPSPFALPPLESSSTSSSSSLRTCETPKAGTHSEELVPAEAKWLSGSLATQKQVFMVPIVSQDPASLEMEYFARPTIPGLAQWPYSLRSSRLIVGGMVDFECTMDGGHPLGRVHAVKLHLCETITLRDPDKPDSPPVEVPMVTFPLAVWGRTPGTVSKPLWEGKDIPTRSTPQCQELSLARRCQLPDESRMRRSTLTGTITPIHVKHHFRLQVYFDIWGEDLHGNPLPTGSGPGEPRLATVTHPIIIASCCFSSRIDLPTYCEAIESPVRPLQSRSGGGPLCACGNPIEAHTTDTPTRRDDAPRALGLDLDDPEPRPVARRSSSSASGKWEYEVMRNQD